MILLRLTLVGELRSHNPLFDVILTAWGCSAVGVTAGMVTVSGAGVGLGVGEGLGVGVGAGEADGLGVAVTAGVGLGDTIATFAGRPCQYTHAPTPPAATKTTAPATSQGHFGRDPAAG
jgi:hypothetical protein